MTAASQSTNGRSSQSSHGILLTTVAVLFLAAIAGWFFPLDRPDNRFVPDASKYPANQWGAIQSTIERLEDLRFSKLVIADGEIIWFAEGLKRGSGQWVEAEYMLAWAPVVYRLPGLSSAQTEEIENALLWVLVTDDCKFARGLAAKVIKQIGISEKQGFAQGLYAYDQDPWTKGDGQCDASPADSDDP